MNLAAITGLLSTFGSLFVKMDETDGKVVINTAPLIALVGLSTVIGCAIQDDESYSQCIKVTLSSVGGLFGV